MAYSCLRLRTIVRHASLGHVFKDGGQTEKAGWGRAAVINTTELCHAKSQFGLATQMGVCACYTARSLTGGIGGF